MFDMTELINELGYLVKVDEGEIVSSIEWQAPLLADENSDYEGQIIVEFEDGNDCPIFLQRTDTCYWWEVYLMPEYTGEISLDLDAKQVAKTFWDQVIASEYLAPHIQLKS
jgi:hypothetical protein